jgi:PAS domain S-box-containing protein
MPIAPSSPIRRIIDTVPLWGVFVVPFVLLTAGAVALVGYLSYRNGQEAVEDLGHQLIAQTNDRVTEKLEDYLETPFLINRLNVDAVNRGQLDLQNTPENIAALESTLLNRLQQFDQVSAILFAGSEGTFRRVERFPTFNMAVADASRPDQIKVYRLNSAGKPSQLLATKENFDVRRDRPWYRQAAAGQPLWSPISRSGATEELTLNAAQPVYDRATNRLLGVFAVHLLVDYLNQFLHDLDISRSGQVIITDDSGVLIATSTKEKLDRLETEPIAGGVQQLRIEESQNDLTRSLGAFLRDRPTVLQASNQAQLLNFRYNGKLQYVRITPFQDQYGLNWRIITVIPQSYFLQAIQTNTIITVLLCLLTLNIAAMLALFVANRLSARFSQIRRVSRELAMGNLNQRLPTNGWIEELNDLSETFNQMADQLQQAFDRIKAALAESEEKFTTIFRTSPEPVAIASLAEGRLLEVNESLLQFFGYSQAEMVGKTALELQLWHNPAQRNHYRALLEQQGSVRNLEVQVCTKSGEVKTVLLSAEIRTVEGQDRIIVMHQDISERKRVEDERQATELALRQSEARYRAIVEDQTELITRSLLDTTLTYVNDAYCRYFGVRREAIIGKSYRPFIYKPEQDEVMQGIRNLSLDNPTLVMENRVVVNGQVRWMQWIDRPLFDEQGNVTEIQAVGRDITELKQTEEALRKSEARLLQAQQIAHLGSWEFDLATRNITWSEELFRIFGLDPAQSEPSYEEIMAVIADEDRDTLLSAIDQAIAEGSSYEIEHRIRRPDGTVRYIISKGQAEINEQQQVTKLFGIVLDMTDRKQTELALQESETRFQEMAQTLNQVSYVLSVATEQYLYISPAYEKIWGYSCASLYQNPKSWLDRVHPEDLEQVVSVLNDLFAGKQKRVQFRIIRADGEVRWIESESLIVCDEDGTPLRIVGLADDITHLKRLEQSLRSQAEEERLLATITQNIRQSLDLEQILSTTVVEVQQRLHADRVIVFRLNPDGLGQVIQEAVVPEYPVSDQMRWEDEHFPEECYAYYRQGKPRIVPDIAADAWAPCLVEFLQEMGVQSKVVAPIVQVCGQSTPRVWGLLVVHACSHRRRWQESEANFLQRICDQLAIAIDQANLYQQLQVELTERKQAEKALQEREAMLRAIGDNLPKGYIYQRVYEPGKGSYYSYISAGIERLLSLKPEAVMKDPSLMRSVGFEEDLVLADRIIQASLDNLLPIELQMRNRTLQGEIQWSSIRSVPRRLEDGRTVWDGVEVDITDLKRTEAALRASEERFRRAFDDAPIGVSLVSLSGQFVRANFYYCNLLGYTEEELLGLTFQKITHPADLAADLEGTKRILAGEIRSFQTEKRYITKQGTLVPVIINIALIRDQNGQPLYIVGYVQDSRERLKVERMKDEFISVVSHELRTPLTSIRGSLGILGSGILYNKPEKAQQMLQIAISNSDRLVRLVDDILSLERLESGKVRLVMEECRIADLLQQAIDSVQALADQSAVTLSLTPISATLQAAPDAIIQTLTNLLSNAIKFSAPGDTVSLKAEISSREWARGNGEHHHSVCDFRLPTPHLLFSVKDQGRGIPEDKLEIVFEQFQQVDVSDSRKKGGTGLGLAICKRIVQQHNGQIWAESFLGKGSTFYVALPLSKRDESAA